MLTTSGRLQISPRLRDVLDRVNSDACRNLIPLLPGLPLVYLLNEIQTWAFKAETTSQRRALFELGDLAIDRHAHTRDLRRRLAEACRGSDEAFQRECVQALPAEDAQLAMEMLALLAEHFDMEGLEVVSRKCFALASDIAERHDLVGSKPIVEHQLGLFLLRRGRFELAAQAMRRAEEGFRDTSQASLALRMRRLRIGIFLAQVAQSPDATFPEDLEPTLGQAPLVLAHRLLARTRQALDRDDLTAAEPLIRELRAIPGLSDPLRAKVSLQESRLMRRRGQYEQADFRLQEAARLSGQSVPGNDLLWEEFYFARDLGLTDRARRAIEDLGSVSDHIRVRYQRALLALKEGDADAARSLLQGCLDRAETSEERANCLAMLGPLLNDPAQARRYLDEATGLYLQQGKHLDHAQCLSQLAAAELQEAMEWATLGFPPEALSPLERADHYLTRAEEIAESLGADPFLVELRMDRGKLETIRGRQDRAMEHFARALAHLELVYLRLSDPRLHAQYARRYTEDALLAMHCALALARPNDAFHFAERSKARRLLRDVAETWSAAAAAQGTPPSSEDVLVATIHPLRQKILSGTPLTTAERAKLNEADASYNRLAGTFQSVSELSGRPHEIPHQPLTVAQLRQIVFSEPADPADDLAEADRPPPPSTPPEPSPVVPKVGGGGFPCSRCHVVNETGSTFCSSCGEIMPKTAALNANLMLGMAREEDLKFGYAEKLYNQAVRRYAEADFRQAEELLSEALQHHVHPDYCFFLGMCRLVDGDAPSALECFRRAQQMQYAGERPFWPLPVSPAQLTEACQLLEAGTMSPDAVFLRLEESHREFLAKRAGDGGGQS